MWGKKIMTDNQDNLSDFFNMLICLQMTIKKLEKSLSNQQENI